MAYSGKVQPGYVNSGNPYHECGVACLEKIAQGHGQKGKKKLGNRHGKKGELSKKTDGGRKTDQSCPKASNPYHECNKYCSYNSAEAVLHGVEKKSGFQNLDGFQRKKKLSESQQKTEQVVNNVPVVKSAYPNDTASPRLPYTIEKKIGLENNQSYSSSLHSSEESHSKNHSFDQGRVHPHEVVPPEGTKVSLSWYAVTPLIKQDEDEEIYRSLKGSSSPVTKIQDKNASGPIIKSSGIFRTSGGSNGDQIEFVISDSCVSVGKYHVRATVASILRLIFEKYGDIAANSRLESKIPSSGIKAGYLLPFLTMNTIPPIDQSQFTNEDLLQQLEQLRLENETLKANEFAVRINTNNSPSNSPSQNSPPSTFTLSTSPSSPSHSATSAAILKN